MLIYAKPRLAQQGLGEGKRNLQTYTNTHTVTHSDVKNTITATLKENPGIRRKIMTNPSLQYKNRRLITDEEIEQMLTKAQTIPCEYARKRAMALIALLVKFGKRRSEINSLILNNYWESQKKHLESLEKSTESNHNYPESLYKALKIENNYLYITFNIRKKHKKGFHQFINYLKKEINSGKLPFNYLDKKNYSQLRRDWEEWTKTKEGHRYRETLRTKKVSVKDRYIKYVLEYMDYLNQNYPNTAYLFPATRYSFGNLVYVSRTEALSGRQLLNIIKGLDKRVWLHHFREYKASKIAMQNGNTLTGIAQVRDTLDLENDSTAMIYTSRYAIQTIQEEA